MQCTQLAYLDESTKKDDEQCCNSQAGGFDKEWAKLNLALTIKIAKRSSRTCVGQSNIRAEFIATEKFSTRAALPPFGCEEFVVMHEE